MLQQYLPFTVLKLSYNLIFLHIDSSFVATVLTVYGIETYYDSCVIINDACSVATVLTVYGIETTHDLRLIC